MLRNTGMVAASETSALREEARQLFLVDAACDAANAHYMRAFGSSHAVDPERLAACAREGLRMLFHAIGQPGDPMQLQSKLEKKGLDYIGMLVKRVAKLRKQEDDRREQLAARKLAEREAELYERFERDAEALRKRRRTNLRGTLIKGAIFVLLLAVALVYNAA